MHETKQSVIHQATLSNITNCPPTHNNHARISHCDSLAVATKEAFASEDVTSRIVKLVSQVL